MGRVWWSSRIFSLGRCACLERTAYWKGVVVLIYCFWAILILGECGGLVDFSLCEDVLVLKGFVFKNLYFGMMW